MSSRSSVTPTGRDEGMPCGPGEQGRARRRLLLTFCARSPGLAPEGDGQSPRDHAGWSLALRAQERSGKFALMGLLAKHITPSFCAEVVILSRALIPRSTTVPKKLFLGRQHFHFEQAARPRADAF